MCRRCHQELGSTGIHSFFVKRGLDRRQLLDRMRALVALNTNTARTTEAEGQTA
jgi:hypothetical protein